MLLARVCYVALVLLMSVYSEAMLAKGPDPLDRYPKTMKLVTYNLPHLSSLIGDIERNDEGVLFVAKEPERRRSHIINMVMRMFKTEQPDIVVLQEVENSDVLEYFNEHYLDNAYDVHLNCGNSTSWGKHISFLVKKTLPFQVVMDSYRYETWKNPLDNRRADAYGNSPVFVRDLPVLRVYEKEVNIALAEPIFILFGAHYKARKPDSKGSWEKSRTYREVEIKRTAEIINRYRKKFGHDAQIILAGDMNGSVNFDKEFHPLWREAKMEDSFNVLKESLKRWKRTTHTYLPQHQSFKGKVRRFWKQLDAVLLSDNLQGSVISSKVYRYMNEFGEEQRIPKSMEEINTSPSDHFPVIVELDFMRMLEVHTRPRVMYR